MAIQDPTYNHSGRPSDKRQRLLQVWIPDTTSDEFVQEAQSQARIIATHDLSTDDQEFIEAVSVSWEDN